MDLHKRLGISDSLLDAVKSITEKKKMDPVDPKANQKDFDDRKDKDIDNDGDVDSTDKYLHRRRKAVTKAVKGEAKKNGKKDPIDTEPSLDNEVGVNEAVHADHVTLHPHPTKKNSYHVGELGRNAKRHLKTGETLSDTEVDDLHDMGMKVKHERKPMKENQLAVTRRADAGVEKVRLPDGRFIFKKKPKKEIRVEKKKISKNYAKMLKSQGKFDSSKYTVEGADGVADQAVDKHNCATHVFHKQFGEGQTIFSMHADPDEYGLIEWYDVMFEHGIEKRVPTSEMKVKKESSHMNHKKKKGE